MDAFDYNKHLIALFYRGSQAYGMATPESDSDLGGVIIPPKKYFLGFCNNFAQTDSIDSVVEKYKDKIFTDNGVEGTLWGILKFIKLASDCNPNMIELLYLDESSYIFRSPEFERLQEVRDLFLSKKARFTFSGYAFSQIKRIKTHKKWLLDPPTKRPDRKDYNLPETKSPQYKEAEALIRHEVDHWAYHDLNLSPEVSDAVKDKTVEQMAYTLISIGQDPDEFNIDKKDVVRRAAMEKIGFDDNLMHLIQREHEYRKASDHYKQYQTWLKTRNPKRAELEAKHGYDTKHGSHVVRLIRMGEEIMRDKKVIVKRPDADELLAIRRGEWSYDKLIEYYEETDAKLKELYKESDLRKTPDINKIDEVCIEIVESKLS